MIVNGEKWQNSLEAIKTRLHQLEHITKNWVELATRINMLLVFMRGVLEVHPDLRKDIKEYNEVIETWNLLNSAFADWYMDFGRDIENFGQVMIEHDTEIIEMLKDA